MVHLHKLEHHRKQWIQSYCYVHWPRNMNGVWSCHAMRSPRHKINKKKEEV